MATKHFILITTIMAGMTLHAGAHAADAAETDRAVSQRYTAFMESRQLIPRGLDPRAFKVHLAAEFYDSYAAYIDLGTGAQQIVYEYYKNLDEANISSIEQKLAEISGI